MKVTSTAVAVLLSLGIMSQARAGGTRLEQLDKNGLEAVSVLSVCSVAYHKFSEKMTKNKELHDSTAKTSFQLYELLSEIVSDQDQVKHLLEFTYPRVTDSNLADTMAGCVKIISNLGK